jgi:hypothetical protein
MARYRTYGQLDDPHGADGDAAFVRFVTRINPEQLQSGELAYSQNGRMDNDRTWQVRKGISLLTSGLVDTSASVLQFDDTGSTPAFDDLGSTPVFTDSVYNAVFGATYFADPVDDVDYIMVATNQNAVALNLSDLSQTTVYYPGAIGANTLTADVDMEQALDSVLVFQDGQTAWKFDGKVDGFTSHEINSADLDTTVAGDVWVETDTAHGLSVGDMVTVSGITFATTDPNGTYRIATVPSTTTFSYDLAGGAEVYTTPGSPTAIQVPGFVEVSTVATSISVDGGSSNAVVSSGVVTVTATAHGRSDGDILTIYDGADSGLTEGDRYEITNVAANTYDFNAEIADGTYGITLGGKQPLGGGYIAMPDPAWGVFHEGRLIVPYKRSMDVGSTNDELVFSDIFDLETYDPILNQLRFGSGSADSLVGVSPLLQDRLLVLCRRSVHVVSGVSGSLADISSTEITREVGCVARKTITEVGGTVMWLSDQGVYSVSYGQELNLIANALPISEPIENEIRKINWEYASNSVAAYADNRYYLAVPYGASTVNNRVFIYNFLNQGWESVDTFPSEFDIAQMVLVPYGGKNEVMLVNSGGAIHRLDQGRDDIYTLDAQVGTLSQPVDGMARTRRYTLGNMDTKRWNRATALVEGETGDGNVRITAQTSDPEQPEVRIIDDQTIEEGQDYHLRARIGRRGYGLQLQFETNTGKVRGCTAEAIIHSRSNTDRS